MALTAVQDLSLRIWGMSLTFGAGLICCLAVYEWIFKFRRTLRPNKLLLLIGSSFFCAMFLCALSYRILTMQLTPFTCILAFMSSVFLELSQAILWRCLFQRLQSVLNSPRFGPTQVKIASVVAYLWVFTLVIFMGIAAIQAKANVILMIRNVYYNYFARAGDGISLGIYGICSFATDMFLMSTLRTNMAARRDRSETDKSLKIKMQSILIILNLFFKMLDFSVKVGSLATSYVPIDSYFRAFNVSFESWTLLKLGVTLEDVMRGESVDSTAQSADRNRLDSVSKGAERTLDQNVNAERTNVYSTPSMS
ncbi:hypothetical protein DFS34DRAFT_377010 [Phlyctochytrium arcticum]|nr:hypothetical protein DFS34DRAFT_377010 [Phlyctochytrium arcticum]